MDSFEFECGRVLENVEVEFSTYGIPKYDEDGYITNAVVFFSSFKGIYSFMKGLQNHLINNFHFDEDDYFVIIATALANPNSCSPSSTELYNDFPPFIAIDTVNFQRQFLAEKFRIKKILGLVGEGLGAFQILTWACEYPDEMEFIFVVNSSSKISGYKYLILKVFENIINDTEDFYSEWYSVSKNKALVTINTLIFAHSASKIEFNKLNNYEIEGALEDFVDEGLFIDFHDIKFRINAIMQYDVEDKLHNIKAKSIFIGTNYNFFNFDLDMLPFKDAVKDSIVLELKDKKEDYYSRQENYSSIAEEVYEFLMQFKK